MIRKNQHLLSQIYAISDLIVLMLSFSLSWWIKFHSGLLQFESHLPLKQYFVWMCAFGVISLLLGFTTSFYTPKRKKTFAYELFKIIQIQFMSLLGLLSVLFLYKEVHISREFIGIFVMINVVLLVVYRFSVKLFLRRFREKGYNRQFVLILGAGSLGKKFYDNLLQYPELGFEVIGFLDDYQEFHDDSLNGYRPILGKIDELENILGKIVIDEVIIALPLNAHHKFGAIISTCEKAGVRAMIIPDFFDYLPARPNFDNFAGLPLINVRDIPLDDLGNRILKRIFDICFSLVAIFLTLPLMVVITIGIKLTSPGPIIFKQERIGLNRRPFYMYKFRTMKISNNSISDTYWTTSDDPRKTPFGAFLRKMSLDELPQFFNVLMGHMSVVGPRPERPFFVEQFKKEIPKYMVKHHVRPGITGLAQSKGLRGDTSIEDRIKEDIFYLENWTLLFDIKIIFKTIINGLKNAY